MWWITSSFMTGLSRRFPTARLRFGKRRSSSVGQSSRLVSGRPSVRIRPPALMDAARATRLVTRPRPIVTRFTRLHAAFLRASGGRYKRSRTFAGGQPVLSLTTTGRKSGRRRSTIIAYLADGASYAVFGMNLGNERDPAWALNLEADPAAEIDVDGRHLRVRAERAAGAEAERLWAAYTKRLPAAERFREIAAREIPIFVLEPEEL